MIESRVGRTERPESRRRRGEPRALAEAKDRDVREPRPALALVQAEPLKPSVEILGKSRRAAVLVGEDEHPHAARLAVAGGREDGRLDCGGGVAKGSGDRRHVARRTAPEKRERDVEARTRDTAEAGPLGKLAATPGDKSVEDVVGKAQRAEEPKPSIALHGIGSRHTRSCRL